jgi:hypothetical protein
MNIRLIKSKRNGYLTEFFATNDYFYPQKFFYNWSQIFIHSILLMVRAKRTDRVTNKAVEGIGGKFVERMKQL